MKEARIMKENITYYLVWIICLLAGCTPTPKQIEDTTDPIPMYPDYTDIMIPTNIAPLNFLLRNDADAMQVTLKGKSKEIQLSFGKKAIFPLNLWESLLEHEIKQTAAIIEYEDGTVDEVLPYKIRFLDSKGLFAQYPFENSNGE